MKFFDARRLTWIPVVVCLLLSACSSNDAGDLPLSGKEFDYQPDEVLGVETVTAGDEEVAEAGEDPDVEIAEETPKKKKGFFSFFRRKNKDQDSEEEPGEEELPPDATDPKEGEDPEGEDPEGVDGEEKPEEKGEAKPAKEIEKFYRLKAGDRVYITLTGSGGLSEEVETVIDEKGGVKLRFIGSVKAAGRTATELEREIEAEYTDRQKIYKEVVARVVVPNTFYFIRGEVRQSGRFPLLGRVTLSQAIPSAGNFTEWADQRKLILARGDERFEIDFKEIAEDPTKDIELQPGDVITVERRRFL